MPELPEVEITARLIGAGSAGASIESALAPGINALKTYDPPLSALEGQTITGVRRRGKLFLIDTDAELTLLIHLMSAGRLQLFDKRASLKDKTSRLLVRLTDGQFEEAEQPIWVGDVRIMLDDALVDCDRLGQMSLCP